MTYGEFLAAKTISHARSGFAVKESHEKLFPFQRFIVRMALEKGRFCIFADCGLGKTFMELEFASQCQRQTKKPSLLVAPLAVGHQAEMEAKRFGYDARFSSRQSAESAIDITNYESLHHFEPNSYGSIVLDESSILKGNGPMRQSIHSFSSAIPLRLACTATPAPNDYTELGNHSELVGNLSSAEMLATYFVHDGGDTSVWRLKGHAKKDFWRWVASWSAFCAKPSDLGFSDEGYALPELRYIHHEVGGGFDAGLLFEVEAESLTERRDARRQSLHERCSKVAEIVSPDEPWLLWCDLNAESEALKRVIPWAAEVKGSDSIEHKQDALLGFATGKYQALITKPSIAGFGMNYQHCSKMAFVGLSDSWEQIYQATRRCWRFGQKRPVEAHIITSKAEGAVVRNIRRKDDAAKQMASELSAIAKEIYVYN
jgi:hypothetical protein